MDIVKNIELVIFDFDGTLLDLNVDWVQLRKSLDIESSSIKLGDHIQNYSVSNNPKIKIVTSAELEALNNRTIDQNVCRVLCELIKTKKIAVFTRNSRRVVEKALKDTGLTESIQIIGREDTALLKPSPEGLIKLINNNKISPNQTLLIGDTYHDIEAAHAANIKVAIVLNIKNQYTPNGADYYLNQLTELISENIIKD